MMDCFVALWAPRNDVGVMSLRGANAVRDVAIYNVKKSFPSKGCRRLVGCVEVEGVYEWQGGDFVND